MIKPTLADTTFINTFYLFYNFLLIFPRPAGRFSFLVVNLSFNGINWLCSTLLVPPREISSPLRLWAISLKAILSAHRDSVSRCTNLTKARKRYGSWCLNQVDCWFLECKKKYKHWENQQSKSKRSPQNS